MVPWSIPVPSAGAGVGRCGELGQVAVDDLRSAAVGAVRGVALQLDGQGQNVYLGQYQKADGSLLSGPSLASLVAKIDAAADQQLQADLQATDKALQAMVDSAQQGQHFDQLIAADNSAGQQIVRNAIAALVKQTASIEQAAARLGISDLNPDTADHSF